jgi:type IV pilus assembly protein PilB
MSISRPGSDDTLGQTLVANGTMSQDQLDFALMLKDAQPDKYLGEILIQIGVPQEKINKALYYSNKRKTIGEILIDQGLISQGQLEEALSKQRHIKNNWELTKTLGQLLIEMGYINSRGLLTALSKQFNMPILSMKNYLPNPESQKVIGKRYAREQKIIVLHDSPNTIKLVMAEPSIQTIEELKKFIPPGKTVEFYLASYSEIDECLKMLSACEELG